MIDIRLLESLEEIKKRLAAIEVQLKAVDTAIQLNTGNILNLRTELLVVKQLVAQSED